MSSAKCIRVSILILALCVFTASHAGEDKPLDDISLVPTRARLALFKAQEPRNRGDFAESALILREFIEKHSKHDHFLVRFQLGICEAQLDNAEEALIHYRAAVELEPRYAQAWLNLGQLAYDQGLYAECAAALRKGYDASEEKRPTILYFAAVAHIQDDASEKALPVLEDLVSGSHGAPEFDWYRALISVSLDLERNAVGERAVSGMLAAYPTEPEAWDLAYQFAAVGGELRQAAVALTVRSYLKPLERDERMQLGNLYAAIGIPARAGYFYESAIAAGSGTATDFERLASAYLAAHNAGAALATLTRALEREPTVKLWSLLGDLQYVEKNYEEAYLAYTQVAEMTPDAGRAYLMRGFCALELKRFGDAREQLGKATAFPAQESSARQLLHRIEQMQP